MCRTMPRFERVIAACAALLFAGFAIAGCIAESKKQRGLGLDAAPASAVAKKPRRGSSR